METALSRRSLISNRFARNSIAEAPFATTGSLYGVIFSRSIHAETLFERDKLCVAF
jgi:hypothetical protein